MCAQRDRAKFLADTHRVDQLLSESDEAVRQGDDQYAYELSLQATKVAPENLDAWSRHATLAPSFEEKLICMNTLNELSPDHQDRRQVAFSTVEELLNRDPFLAYLEETEALYRVIHKNNMVVVIPKRRTAVNPTLPERTGPLKPAYRLLAMAILGLLLSGVGTLVFAPLAMLAALRAGPALQSQAERVSSRVVLILAGLLFALGLGFAYLFALHWTG